MKNRTQMIDGVSLCQNPASMWQVPGVKSYIRPSESSRATAGRRQLLSMISMADRAGGDDGFGGCGRVQCGMARLRVERKGHERRRRGSGLASAMAGGGCELRVAG